MKNILVSKIKITLNLLILIISLLLVGCSNAEEKPREKTSTKSNVSVEDMEAAKKEDKESARKTGKDLKITKDSNELKEKTLFIEKSYDTSKEGIDELKSKSKSSKIYTNTQIEGNVLLLLETDGAIKNIRVHELGEEFMDVGVDIDAYLEKYSELNYIELEDVILDKNNSIIIRLHEPETIPNYCITWTDELGNKGYYVVAYGFNKDGTEIERETVKINVDNSKNEDLKPTENMTNKLSEEEAIYLVKDKLIGEGLNAKIKVDHIEGNNYVIQVYELVEIEGEGSHIATLGWYNVDMYTGEITNLF